MTKDVNYLVLSDIHLGSRRNRTYEIILNLNRYFDNFQPTSQFTDLDILFIAGDLFDRLLDFSSSDIHEATIWLSRLIGFCSRHHIRLRVLEGTPSHDWKQSKIIETLYALLQLPVDLLYVDTLHIETMHDLGMTILYMPDEWTANTDLTFSQVQELMHSQQLSQVDIGIFHGCFGYQVRSLPGHIQHHDENNYLPIVKHYINIGHFHSFSTYERIIAQGSFDRLSMNEEEAKGGVRVYLSQTEGNRFEFIANPGAKIFQTIHIKDPDLDKALTRIDRIVRKLPDNSYVRIKSSTQHPIYSSLDRFKAMYPCMYFSRVSVESIVADQVVEHNTAAIDYVPITITPDNIIDLLVTAVLANHQIDPPQLKLLTEILGDTHAQF